LGPAAGDVLEGELTEIDSWESKFKDDDGRPKVDPVLTILRDDGEELRFFAHAAQAKRQIQKFDPPLKPGARIAIGYHGKRDPDDDQSPHRYRIVREERAVELDDEIPF
jgi:hypothetical protein